MKSVHTCDTAATQDSIEVYPTLKTTHIKYNVPALGDQVNSKLVVGRQRRWRRWVNTQSWNDRLLSNVQLVTSAASD